MELVPIKVKIGLRANGHADHPDWTQLPMINYDGEMRQYAPHGWIYDKSCGHQEVRGDSPYGMQWGCLLCTQEFADSAMAAFPDLITQLTEAEFEDFYDNYAKVNTPENKIDINVLQGLQIELELKEKLNVPSLDITTLKTKIAKAIDPADSEAGIVKNKERYWVDFKGSRGIKIKA